MRCGGDDTILLRCVVLVVQSDVRSDVVLVYLVSLMMLECCVLLVMLFTCTVIVNNSCAPPHPPLPAVTLMALLMVEGPTVSSYV